MSQRLHPTILILSIPDPFIVPLHLTSVSALPFHCGLWIQIDQFGQLLCIYICPKTDAGTQIENCSALESKTLRNFLKKIFLLYSNR